MCNTWLFYYFIKVKTISLIISYFYLNIRIEIIISNGLSKIISMKITLQKKFSRMVFIVHGNNELWKNMCKAAFNSNLIKSTDYIMSE